MLFSLLLACAEPGVLDEQFFVRNAGADMRVHVQGNADSQVFLLMVHGGPGGNAHEYNYGTYADDLEERYAMVWWDQRGQGGSVGRYRGEDVTLQQMAEDGEAVVDFLKAHYGEDIEVFLFGHSWGGTLGTAMLLQTDVQEDLAGWIESDGAHDIPRLNAYAVEMFLEYGNRELDAGRNKRDWKPIVSFAESVDPSAVSLDEGGLINSYGQEAEGLMPEVEYSYGEGGLWDQTLGSPVPLLQGFVSGGDTAWRLFEEVEAAAYTDELHRVEIPTLLLWGRYDFVVPPGLGEDALERIPDSEMVYFEHSGHSPMDGEAEAYVGSIVDFVDARSGG